MFQTRLLLFVRLFRAQWVVYGLKLISLAVAFACAVLVFSFASKEFTVNTDQPSCERIFRVLRRNDSPDYDRNRLSDRIPSEISASIRLKIGENATTTRIKVLEQVTAIVGQRKLSGIPFHAADHSLGDVFDFDFIDGQSEPKEPGALLSASKSLELFGTTASAGKEIKVATANDTIRCTVAAVFNDWKNMQEDFEIFLMLNDQMLSRLGFNTDNSTIYGRLKNLSSKADFQSLPTTLSTNPDVSYHVQYLDDVYFGPRVRGENSRHGDQYSIWILICIASLIIILAITNYANLTTLTLPARSTELAISKVAGAQAHVVCARLLQESAGMCTLAFTGGVLLLTVASPILRDLFSLHVDEWLSEVSPMAVLAIAVVMIAAALAPLYPILVFTHASPRRLLSADLISFPRFKRAITTLQLGTSISLVVAGMVISRQIERSLIKEPGKNHDQIVYLRYPKELTRLDEVKLGWQRHNPNIAGVTASSQMPNNLVSRDSSGHYNLLTVERDFFNFFDVHILKGRTFGPNDRDSVMTNPSGINVVGKKPIGVVEDFGSIFNQPERPLQIRQTNDYKDYDFLFIRILEVNVRDTYAYLIRFFREVTADPVKISFLDHNYESMLRYEDTLNGLSRLLTLVGIAMACFAIYALSLSRINDNLKQIAIRRTFGASRSEIILLMSREFVEQLLAACFVFGPVTFLLLRSWLKNFVYAAHMHWIDPLIGLAACVTIILITNSSLILRLGKAATSRALRR